MTTGVLRPVLGACLLTALGSLPIFLLATQSIYVRGELGFDESRFGVTVACFYGAAAVFAVLGGRAADRLGRRASTVSAGVLAAVGGFGVALWAETWADLLGMTLLLGAANAGCQVTANLSMASAVPPHRQGVGFAAKQAALPVAVLVAGVSVPLVDGDWRSTFLGTGITGVAVVLLGLYLPHSPSVRAGATASARDRVALTPLLVTAVAMALASAGVNALGSFVASWGYEVGLTPGQSAGVMAVGSGLNVLARLASGLLADRRQGRNLPVVAGQMLIGGLALAALSIPSSIAFVPATVAAFALGWSWPGLLIYAVVRLGRDQPATASGLVQAGAFAGGAAGPLTFGFLIELMGYEAAWRVTALAFILGALFVLLARRLFIRDLTERPPRKPLGTPTK